jgi:hypothetical protein
MYKKGANDPLAGLSRLEVSHPLGTLQGMDRCDLLWVAGLLEGEGCFRLHRDCQRSGSKRYVYYRPRVICAMTDLDVIERLQRVTGMGRIALGRKTAPHHKPCWQWTVSRDGDAISLMKALHPHRGERRRANIDEILTRWPLVRADNVTRGHGTSRHRVDGEAPLAG